MDETTQGDDTPTNDQTDVRKALIDLSEDTIFHAFSPPVNTNDALTQIQDEYRGRKKRNKDQTTGNTKINGKKKNRSEDSYDKHPYKVWYRSTKAKYAVPKTKKKIYADDKVEEAFSIKSFLQTVKDYPDHTLNFHGYTGENHKGSLPTEPMDINTARQESGLLSPNESFSELVSPSSAGTLQFYRPSETTSECDAETSYSGTPSFGCYLNTSAKYQQNPAKKFKMFLQKNYEYFKDELYPEELADILLSKDILKSGEREQISEEKFRASKSDRLIKSLVRHCLKTKETDDQIFVQRVIESFSEAKYGYLFANFEDFEEENIEEGLPVDNLWMGKLSYFASLKGDELDALALIDRLLAKEVITFDEHQNILDIPCKQDKIDTLVKFIKGKTFRHYDSFCQIIKEEYPDVASMLNEEIYERMEISLGLEQMPIVELNVQKVPLQSQDSMAETAVKMTIKGDSDSGNEIEHMIVDANSPKPQEGLQAMVMDGIHSEMWVSFSCIKITLDCISERSRMLLMQKCKESPTFLEGWIKELFDEKKMKMLLDRGHHKINFKIHIHWPEFVMTRRDIAQNYEYLKRELEPRDYGKILLGVKGGEDVIKIVSSKAPRDVRCREFIVHMVANDKAPVEKLSALLNGSEVIEVIKRKRRNSNRLCTCRLTKKGIVEHFTLLEKKVLRIDDIIKIFADFPGFDDDVKSIFEAISTQDSCKTEKLLRAILELPDDELQVCLFEDSLKETNQEELLKQIISKRVNKEECMTITKEDINRNISFLQQELEPMGFISILPQQDDKNELRDKILEAKSRRQRCKLFLDFLKDSDEATLKTFTLKLRRLRLNNIIDCLFSARQQGLAENCITKEDISENIGFLEDMLDPMNLIYILIGNENDKSRTALDKVLSASKKRRCKVFLDIILNAEERVFKKFTTYLEKQMPVVYKYLVNARGQKDRIKSSVLESLLDSYSFIVEEIEPSRLKHIFIERQVITNEDFQLILSNQSRRSRAIALMAHVLKGPVSMAQSMMDALEYAGYKSLIRRINETNEKFRECPKLYRIKLGGDECFAFEGTIKMIFDQTTNMTDLDVSVPLSREKIEQINHWIEEGAACGDCMGPDDSKMSANHGTGHKENTKHTMKQFEQREESDNMNTPGILNPRIDWYDCANSFSSPASSQFQRADDEAADKCSTSVDRSNSVCTINEDSNIGDSLDSPQAVVPDHYRVRHDSTSTSCEYIKGVDQVNSDLCYENLAKNHTALLSSENGSIEKKCMSEQAETEVITNVCRCDLGNANGQNALFDARMGKCEQHGLYYIQ